MKRFIGIVAALAVLAMAFPVAAAAPAGGAGLSPHDQELLAGARAAGKGEVTLLVAGTPGANAALAQRIATLGGNVRYSDESLGYLRVRVPAARAAAVARLWGVQAVNLDEIIPLDDPRPEAVPDPTAVAPPGPDTPAVNPYLPTGDIGAPQFVAAHPTYDGRGVKIGFLDTGIDLLTPELQTAKLLDGTPVRKIIDWVTYTDPITDDDPTWVNMADQVVAAGGSLTYQGTTYAAPYDGRFRIGLFDERDPRLGGELENDVNRDGNPAGSSGLFAVLWDTAAERVWVDANQNKSFADEKAMRNYRERYDVGLFGSDDPATPLRDSIPFVIQTDPINHYVNIGIVSGSHGTHTAGIAAGKGFFGGAFNGAAPEAQLISVRVCLFVSGCTSHALIEGMIYAVKQAGADVINMSIGGLPALNDGNNTRALLYNRLIDQFKVQMFISAGNSGPGLNTVGDPSVATRVMSVGAYVTRDSWLYNYGALAAKPEGLFVFSSRGPREDGGFKPNLVAPGSAVSTIPAWEQNYPLVGPLPPGYDMFNGTSMAAPEATGGTALLISAAKQAGVQYKPDQLRQALNSSAHFLADYGAHAQGNGLMQVGAAWELLKGNIKTVEISSTAPVKTVLSPYLAAPGLGQGIYEREGWSVGQSRTRTIAFTRLTGPARPVTFRLTWVGNDGTFSSAASIRLEKGIPAALPVSIAPIKAGVHSAILNLDDPATPGIDYQVLNTVVATVPLDAAGNFTVSSNSQADRPDSTSFFVVVPAKTPVLRLDLTGVNGRVRLLTFHPYGVPYDTALYQTGGSQARSITNPAPGVWEATVDTSRASAVTPATFTLKAALLGAGVSPTRLVVDPATVSAEYSQAFTFTNRFGAFTGGAVGTPLASVYASRPSIATGSMQVFSINVPAGATSVSARIGNPADNGADLDLYLYDCTTGACMLAAYSAGGTADEYAAVKNPTAGVWKVLVDGYDVPSGKTAYDYQDLIAHPGYGAVSISDPAALHDTGASWSATASVAAAAAPEAGRFLQGFVQVRSGSTVLGAAEVDLNNLSS